MRSAVQVWSLFLALALLGCRVHEAAGGGGECPGALRDDPSDGNSTDNVLAATAMIENCPDLNWGPATFGRGWVPDVLDEEPFPPDEYDVITPLLSPVTGAHFDRTVGEDMQALVARLDDEEFENLGLALLDRETFIEECEAPFVDFTFAEGGTDYEARFEMSQGTLIADGVRRLFWRSMPETCVTALRGSGGDVEAAGCEANIEASFFPEGSDCRACIEESGGDVEACTEEDRCERGPDYMLCVCPDAEEPDTFTCHRAARAWFLGCAPDYGYQHYLLYTPAEGQEVARVYHNDEWNGLVLYFWDDGKDGLVEYFNFGSSPEYTTVATGIPGRVKYIREAGTEGTPWSDRRYYVSSIETDDHVFGGFWASDPGYGSLSSPLEYEDTDGDGEIGPGDDGFGFTRGGWGFPPWQERPDGSSKALDYIAAYTLKTSSRRDGAWVYVYNHNRCQEDSWIGPDEHGAWRCGVTVEPEGGWHNDGEISTREFADGTTAWTVTPMATLATTGEPDPLIPGGFVIHVAGSPALANPDWEGCTHVHSFQPDLMVYDKGLPGLDEGSILGNTYRFGKDDSGIRMVLHASMERYYCPEGGP
jgi:hypothetical protein